MLSPCHRAAGDWLSRAPAVSLEKGLMPTATRPLTNAQGTRLQPYLRACPGIYVGHAVRSRLLVEAVVWIARAGAPWRQWPAKYGKGNSVCRR